MNLQAHREVKSIVDEILMNVSDAIDVIYVHDMVEDIVLDMVEEAMHRSRQREIQNASLRHDLEVIDYRRNRQLVITNPMNGDRYLVSLKAQLMWGQLKDVGYDVQKITAGSTKHLYAALRAAIPDLRRSTSLRIWYTDDSGENVTVSATDVPALWLVGKKLFMMRL
jgi:hypothetical protein